jgi:hypothetical protein
VESAKLKALCVFATAAAVCLVEASPAAGADGVYVADPKPPTDGRLGSNYTPAYAVNQVHFWHDFRAEAVERELAAARTHFGMTTLRVYLHNINFDKEKDVFLANIERGSCSSTTAIVMTGYTSTGRPSP